MKSTARTRRAEPGGPVKPACRHVVTLGYNCKRMETALQTGLLRFFNQRHAYALSAVSPRHAEKADGGGRRLTGKRDKTGLVAAGYCFEYGKSEGPVKGAPDPGTVHAVEFAPGNTGIVPESGITAGVKRDGGQNA